MASKNKAKSNQPDHVSLAFVKNAGWVRTIIKDGKQTQEWLGMEKPND